MSYPEPSPASSVYVRLTVSVKGGKVWTGYSKALREVTMSWMPLGLISVPSQGSVIVIIMLLDRLTSPSNLFTAWM